MATSAPPSLSTVDQQPVELSDVNSKYIGAFVENKLKGYMKIADWSEADERQFITQEGEELDPKLEKLGIFGLAVSNKLKPILANEATQRLFYEATNIALGEDKSAINIAFNGLRSAYLQIAREQGFRFTGRVNEPVRRIGVVQRLYSKTLDT